MILLVMAGHESKEPTAPLEELVTRFMDERARDGSLDIEAFVARYPDHAGELRDILQGLELMEEAAEAYVAGDTHAKLKTLADFLEAGKRLA